MLLILFVGHLGMVTGGALCTTPGMANMSESPSSMAGPMADMESSSVMQAGTVKAGAPNDPATSEHGPCSDISHGTCVTGMPCVTALSAPAAEALASPGAMVASGAVALIVTMPVTPGSAPDLPPPRV